MPYLFSSLERVSLKPLKLCIEMPLPVLSVQAQLHTECPKDTLACSILTLTRAGAISTRILHFNKCFHFTVMLWCCSIVRYDRGNAQGASDTLCDRVLKCTDKILWPWQKYNYVICKYNYEGHMVSTWWQTTLNMQKEGLSKRFFCLCRNCRLFSLLESQAA